jgi:hypothetical protein
VTTCALMALLYSTLPDSAATHFTTVARLRLFAFPALSSSIFHFCLLVNQDQILPS